MDDRERIARDDAIRKWSDALTEEDISGDPRDLTISIAQTMWHAGRDYALSAATASGEAERLEAIVKEAWRFWAAMNESALEPLLDRGYTLLRVRTDKYRAFDDLFRVSKALADRAAGEREAERLAELARSRALLLNSGCDDHALQDEILDFLGQILGPLPEEALADRGSSGAVGEA